MLHCAVKTDDTDKIILYLLFGFIITNNIIILYYNTIIYTI